jgi:hypothetical protein
VQYSLSHIVLDGLGALGAPIYRYVTLSCKAIAFAIFCCHYALAVALVCILHACMPCIHVFMWVLSVYSAL